ncbi:hypothetical protein M569_16517 [Genlisea aurea]|uniref:Uncharacterized protein n=1 Tax=Genlisea aurea TaxID=192259 RepID=S8BUP2_9LAMI|nr:hypothetical protein M569_16517 [Genlisea aurea]
MEEVDRKFGIVSKIFDENSPDRWEKISEVLNGMSPEFLKSKYESYLREFGTLTGEVTKKKVSHWTEDEHRKFMQGLEAYGKGNWKKISNNFVITKTHTQVASHAQKYFLHHQGDDNNNSQSEKKRKRPSIHDTTIHDVVTPRPIAANVSSTSSTTAPPPPLFIV